MAGLLTVRDYIRDILRKYDEITTPLFRFIASYIMFISINSLFGYSKFFDKGIVIFLLAVICALVADSAAVLIGAIVLLINSFAASIEVGIVMFVVLLVMYCVYMRMFPACGWVLAFVPIMYMLKLSYAIPLIVVIFAGASGIVPTAFGAVIYYLSTYIREMVSGKMFDDKDFQSYTYMLDAITKNKELLVAIIVFSVVILVTSIIYKLPFDYSWYVAIGIGGVLNIFVFLICSFATQASVNMGSLIISSILGILIALLVQLCKGIVDYSAKETVQFEDDEYYYYVKAIPKLNSPDKKKSAGGVKAGEVKKRMSEQPDTVNSKNVRGR